MKVNFLVFSINGVGGTVRVIITLANYLAEKGYDVNIVSVFKYQKPTYFNIDPRVKIKFLVDRQKGLDVGSDEYKLDMMESELITEDEEYKSFSLLTDKMILDELSNMRNEILITTRPSLNLLASKYAPEDVCVVAQEHLNLNVHSQKLKDEIEKNYKNLDYLITLTSDDTKEYVEFLKNSKVKVRQITNGVPMTDKVTPKLENKVIMAAGRIVEQKGFDLLVCAYNILRHRYPDWKIKIYGEGKDEKPLRMLVEEIGLSENILFMGTTDNMQEAFKEASIFALSSRYEGFGMVIVEAMQCGVPVVSFDCPKGPSEIISHGEDGILVEDGNVAAFAQALANLIEDQEERKRLGSNASENIKRYSIDEIGKQWEDLFKEIDNKRKIEKAIKSKAKRNKVKKGNRRK